MKLTTPSVADYSALINIWEDSVVATHHFLTASDIARLKPLILEHYFDAVSLQCAVNASNEIVGFVGVSDANVEMLFVAPQASRQGIGKALMQWAFSKKITKVDVNEQNPDALAFYHAMNFTVVDRSETDGEGNPFPLLHMALIHVK